MSIDLDALEAALETDDFAVRKVNGQEDEFSFDGQQWRRLEALSESQRATYNARAAELSAPQVRRVGTAREFLKLFSATEKLAFFEAAKASAYLQVWWAEASTGEFSLDHSSVADGLSDLVDAGVITAERAAEIQSANFAEV